jgi:hypothetical protein
MHKNTLGFGFKKDPYQRDKIYFNKFVCVEYNGHSVFGILKKIDRLEGYAYLRPSLVGKADGFLKIVSNVPTKISLPLTVIRPIPGTLEEYVNVYNKNLKNKNKRQRRK